ncbi:hypothetical protein BJ165DRAFT_1401346 [Panaeolus papilionaceus]|nr:hypothetical protein BJ165DRAFT_1401346 [Panaeolus papilionaceus]
MQVETRSAIRPDKNVEICVSHTQNIEIWRAIVWAGAIVQVASRDEIESTRAIGRGKKKERISDREREEDYAIERQGRLMDINRMEYRIERIGEEWRESGERTGDDKGVEYRTGRTGKQERSRVESGQERIKERSIGQGGQEREWRENAKDKGVR